jgi:hypothetical protein
MRVLIAGTVAQRPEPCPLKKDCQSARKYIHPFGWYCFAAYKYSRNLGEIIKVRVPS